MQTLSIVTIVGCTISLLLSFVLQSQLSFLRHRVKMLEALANQKTRSPIQEAMDGADHKVLGGPAQLAMAEQEKADRIREKETMEEKVTTITLGKEKRIIQKGPDGVMETKIMIAADPPAETTSMIEGMEKIKNIVDEIVNLPRVSRYGKGQIIRLSWDARPYVVVRTYDKYAVVQAMLNMNETPRFYHHKHFGLMEPMEVLNVWERTQRVQQDQEAEEAGA